MGLKTQGNSSSEALSCTSCLGVSEGWQERFKKLITYKLHFCLCSGKMFLSTSRINFKTQALNFHTLHGVLKQEYWSGLPFLYPVDHVLSELSTITSTFLGGLHGMAHSFIELHKAVIHVIILVIFLWLRLSTEELMLANCDVGEDSWESLGLQGDETSPS